MPALKKISTMQYVGVAVARHRDKAEAFAKEYGGLVFDDFDSMLLSDQIDAVYIPLPPALHFEWARKALNSGKHILVEKPFTTELRDTTELLSIAKAKGLAVHENYMFPFHSQISDIEGIINSGEIGDVRLYRVSFGFPMRDASDFRYDKSLGGGALLDCGGYTLKYASYLLGPSAHIVYAQSNYISGYDVDMYGSAALVNDSGVTVQTAFGMDHNYKCELEVWGSKGSLYTNRILTAPAGYEPDLTIKRGNQERVVKLCADDAFLKSILHFQQCILEDSSRENNYLSVLRQSELLDDFKQMNKE